MLSGLRNEWLEETKPGSETYYSEPAHLSEQLCFITCNSFTFLRHLIIVCVLESLVAEGNESYVSVAHFAWVVVLPDNMRWLSIKLHAHYATVLICYQP